MLHTIPKSLVFTAALLVFAGSACAANLVTNPDFDNGTTGWTNVQSGTISSDPTNGYPTQPSLQVSAGAANTTAEAASECIAVTQGNTYAASTYVNAKVGRVVLDVAFYSTAAINVATATPSVRPALMQHSRPPTGCNCRCPMAKFLPA